MGEDLSEINFVPPNKEAFDMTNAILVGCTLPGLDQLLGNREIRTEKGGAIETNIYLENDAGGDLAELLGASGSTDISSFHGLGVQHLLEKQLKERSSFLSGALIDQTTSIKGGGDIELLVKFFGARFVTQDELRRMRTRKVFISYAWADELEVGAIEQWLREKGLVTMIDRRDFFAGESIEGEIIRSMSDADAILLFHSERTENKPWIEFERELARQFQETATPENREPPQIIYIVLDDTALPDSEKGKIAIMAKGNKFPLVCQEIYDSILRIPKTSSDIDLSKWEDYVFPGKVGGEV